MDPQHKATNTKQLSPSKEQEESAAKAALALRSAAGSSSTSLQSEHGEGQAVVASALTKQSQGEAPSGKLDPPAAPAGRPERSTGRQFTSAKLNPADVASITAGLKEMTQYHLHGIEGVRQPDATGLPPSAWNWRHPGGGADNPKLESWTTQTWMGFYWFSVCRYRNKRGMPLTLPNWGRLGREVKALRDTMDSWKCYRYISFLVGYFDEVRAFIGKAGDAMVLNESALNHSLIRQAADSLLALASDPSAFSKKIDELRKPKHRMNEFARVN
jgi:hypothetical protein